MFHSNAFEVRDLGRAISRRRLVVFVSVLAFVGLALALNTLTRPVFRSAARLEIRPAPSRSPLTGVAIETPTPVSENLTLLTTAERILTRDVLERSVRALESRGVELAPQPQAFADVAPRSGRAGATSGLHTAGIAAPEPGALQTPETRMSAQVDWMLRSVSVRPIRDTRLVDVQAEHSNPRAAADIANTVAAEFVRGETDNRRAADAGRLNSLRGQATDIGRTIQSSEKSLYGSQSTSLVLASERSKQLAQSATELGSSILKARTDLRAVDNQLDRIRVFRRSAAPDWSNPPVQTPAMDDLHRDLQRTLTEILAQRRVYRDGSQELAMLESQANALREAMRAELQKTFSDLEGQREVLAGRFNDLQDAIAGNERSLKALSDSSYKYSTLESELGTRRDLYTLLLRKVQEQDIAQLIQPPSVEIVQTASAPLQSVRPRKAVNLAVGLMLGLVFGSGLALALEAFRRTLRTPRDVSQLLQLPVMGMIPKRTGVR